MYIKLFLLLLVLILRQCLPVDLKKQRWIESSCKAYVLPLWEELFISCIQEKLELLKLQFVSCYLLQLCFR
uniref:Putative secreted protein n=1 Tax=Xenopsylla cheopis TaxID=163159 RepID=A0A6M2E118_XENCH